MLEINEIDVYTFSEAIEISSIQIFSFLIDIIYESKKFKIRKQNK